MYQQYLCIHAEMILLKNGFFNNEFNGTCERLVLVLRTTNTLRLPLPTSPPTTDLKLKLNEEIIFLAISSLKCILKSMICVIVLFGRHYFQFPAIIQSDVTIWLFRKSENFRIRHGKRFKN